MAVQRRMRSTEETNGDDDGGNAREPLIADEVRKPQRIPQPQAIATIVIALITYFTYPGPLNPTGKPTVLHVWYFGWISALSTGLGVVPLIFTHELDSYWIGASNGALLLCFTSHSLMSVYLIRNLHHIYKHD